MIRCLALAQAWRGIGGRATFASATEAPPLENLLKIEGIKVVHLSAKSGSINDANETTEVAHQLNAEWIVVDGYHFDAGYQKNIKESGHRLLFFDDNEHADYYYADIVLNQNVHACEEMYVNKQPYTRLLLGTEYALLRREFLKRRPRKRKTPEVVSNVLVTLGGSDPNHLTLWVVKALDSISPGTNTHVVAGSLNSDLDEIRALVERDPEKLRLSVNAATTEMADAMAEADLAIHAAGTTFWELACMGVPSISVVAAENQQVMADEMEKIGATRNLGGHMNVDVQKITSAVRRLASNRNERKAMTETMMKLVDGKGARRVVEVLAKDYRG